jgi:hypothetical protein
MMHLGVYFLLATAVGGVWEGSQNDLPAVELTLKQDGERVSGTIGFYFQTRGEDGKWKLGPKSEGEVLDPKLDGNVLTFETPHYKKHGGTERGPNKRFRVTFVSAIEARLKMWEVGEAEPNDGSPGFKLVRRQ